MSYRPQLPLSLCLITKNEAANIKKFAKHLDWLSHKDDEVVVVDTGSTDGTPAMLRKRISNCTVIERPDLQSPELLQLIQEKLPEQFAKFANHAHYRAGLLRSFAEARNLSFEAAKNDLIMWLDLDDILVDGENLRRAVDMVFGKEKLRGALFLKYAYTISEHGEITTTLWRERVVTKGDFEWKGACHETLIPKSGSETAFARDPDFPSYVSHVGAKSHEFSDLRNYALLWDAVHNKKDGDPRSVFYLANAARGLGLHAEAIDYYRNFIPYSGNPDDILAAQMSLASCYAALGMFRSALEACASATVTSPGDPRPHYVAASVWSNVENWQNAIKEVQIGDGLQAPDTLHALEPHMLEFQPAAILATAYRELHMPREAMQAAQRAAQARPNAPEIQKTMQDYMQWASAEQAMQETMRVVYHAPDQHQALKVVRLSPHLLQRGIGAPEEAAPGDKDKKSIAFWCGTSAEAWGPSSMEKGIGASEKMVYDVATNLAKLGWNVQVYCTLNCPEGEYEGVNWRFTAHFNPEVYRDIVVIWRVPAVCGKIPFRAGKVFVWMHDVGRNADWTPTVLANVDKVLFLSRFQRSLHPSVPEEKVYYTRNGIDLDRHLYDGRVKEKKIIFCSSPDRGFTSSVKAFRLSGLDKEGWQLHLFYGFGKTWRKMAADMRYQHIPDLGYDCDSYRFSDMCAACCDDKAVFGRGRVGWKQMAEEMKSARIWLYPTVFDEISCVAAMEAMAAGNALVTTTHGALAETCKDYGALWDVGKEGRKADLRQAAIDLHDAAKADLSPAVLCEHARRFDVKVLVETWCKELFV